MRVLVVDDYPSAGRASSALLEVLGHECRVAETGEAALVLFESFAPDIVVLDLDLPGHSGYEIARKIRTTKNGARVFIAALTGLGYDEQRSLDAGFDMHAHKPASAALLESIITAAAQRYS
jgi:DNA-binding response OmpR family regulator